MFLSSACAAGMVISIRNTRLSRGYGVTGRSFVPQPRDNGAAGDQELATASPSFGGHDHEQEQEAARNAGVNGARTRNLRRDRAAL